MSDLMTTIELWVDANEAVYTHVREAVMEATRNDLGYRDLDPDDFDAIHREGRQSETYASIGLAVRDCLLDTVGDAEDWSTHLLRDILNNVIDVDDLGAVFAIEDPTDYREWVEAR